jgi:phosphoglycolate phosphatase
VLIRRSVVNSDPPRYIASYAMTHTAVLFDLDGTLLDTLEDLGDSMNAVLGSLGFPPHGMDSYRYFVGDGVEILARRALPEEARNNDALVRDCVMRMRAEYGRRWKDKTHLYDGIAELLDGLMGQGAKSAILSNKPHAAVIEVVNHFFPRWRFDATLGARPGVPIKPDAGAAREVAKLLDVPPEGFLYVGDTNTDMATAVAAGMFPVGASWGFRTEQELRASGARAIAAHPREVLKLL